MDFEHEHEERIAGLERALNELVPLLEKRFASIEKMIGMIVETLTTLKEVVK